MSMSGPVPNRSNDLSRERDANRGDRMPIATGQLRDVAIPDPDPDWHPIARMLWDGALASGQADFYQQSDLALLFSLCDDISTYKKPAYIKDDGTEVFKPNGQILATIYGAFERLLITEGDRRRARIELTAPPSTEPTASVAVMADYRDALYAVPDLPKTD